MPRSCSCHLRPVINLHRRDQTERKKVLFEIIVPLPMASTHIRHVGSPLTIAGVILISPKVSQPWSPSNSVSLKNSTPSPIQRGVHGVPSSKRKYLDVITPEVPRKGKCVRKLPWSDGRKHSSIGRHISALSVLNFCDTPRKLKNAYSDCPSFDTPDRAEALRKFKLKSGIIHVLGKGSFGTVVKASYKGNLVAVKILNSSPESCTQIANEMNSLQLHHDNIVSVFKVLPETDIPGIVIMEQVLGSSLQKILDCGLLQYNLHQCVRYSRQISSALAYCHERGVLHLDVKPRNVLVDVFSDTCKLCDFGSSCRIDAVTYTLQGTVGYVAPELLRGEKPTTAADVYSLGITMWQLMSGKAPYAGEPEHTVIYKVVATEYRPQLPEPCSPSYEKFLSIFKKCWSQTPESRISVSKVIEELITIPM